MARKRAAPYPEPPFIPDSLWLPFVVSLTGDSRSDNRSIHNLARMLSIDPEMVRFKLREELAEGELVIVHPAHHVLQ